MALISSVFTEASPEAFRMGSFQLDLRPLRTRPSAARTATTMSMGEVCAVDAGEKPLGSSVSIYCDMLRDQHDDQPQAQVLGVQVVRGCKDDQVWRIGLASKAHNPLKI